MNFVRRSGKLLVIVATLLAVVTMGRPAEAQTPLRVAVIHMSDVLALYVAADEGIFERHGLKVEITAVANQSVVVSSLISKSIDVGFSVPPTVIQAKEAGIDTTVMCGATEFPMPKPAYAGIIARTGSGIKSVKDLVGKKVGVISLNTFHHILVRRWLEENNVDASKVTFVEMGLPQMSDLMKAGQVDAVVTVDPFYNRMISQGVAYAFAEYLETVPSGVPIDFYIGLKSWVDANPETAKKFCAALGEAIKVIHANQATARASLAKWTKFPPAVIESTVIPRLVTEVTASSMNWWIDLTKKQGLVSKAIKGEDFIIAK